MISASAIPRLLACPASAVLPQRPYNTDYADQGTDAHAEIEAAIDVGDESAIPDAVLAVIQPGDETTTERAFAYDTANDTGRELTVSKRRYVGLSPFEIPGTPDLIVRGRRVTIVDHKGYKAVQDAERNEQAATYGLTVARAWNLDEIDLVIHYRAEWRRPTYATLTSLDLDAHAAKLKQLQVDVAAAHIDRAPYLRPGPHCEFCPAFMDCPKQAGLARLVDRELAVQIEGVIPFDRDEDAADAFDLLQRIKLLTTRITAALYARAAERPIPLNNGNVLGPVTKQGKREIDPDKAYEAVRLRYGQAIADRAVQRKVAQSWIEDALTEAGVQSPKKAKDALVKELEGAGAVTRKTKTVIEEHPPLQLVKESA